MKVSNDLRDRQRVGKLLDESENVAANELNQYFGQAIKEIGERKNQNIFNR